MGINLKKETSISKPLYYISIGINNINYTIYNELIKLLMDKSLYNTWELLEEEFVKTVQSSKVGNPKSMLVDDKNILIQVNPYWKAFVVKKLDQNTSKTKLNQQINELKSKLNDITEDLNDKLVVIQKNVKDETRRTKFTNDLITHYQILRMLENYWFHIDNYSVGFGVLGDIILIDLLISELGHNVTPTVKMTNRWILKILESNLYLKNYYTVIKDKNPEKKKLKN